MPNRMSIFIDNAHFQNVMRDEFGRPRIDYGALAQKVAGDSDILRAYVYDCPTYQGKPPTADESEWYSRQRKFFHALERLPRFEVRFGKLAHTRPRQSRRLQISAEAGR